MDYDVAYCEIKSNENQSNPIASNLMGGGVSEFEQKRLMVETKLQD